jgi:hypothetical protein
MLRNSTTGVSSLRKRRNIDLQDAPEGGQGGSGQ